MEFRKNSDILPKILIHKEVVIFVWNCAFSDKNDKFRQNGQVVLAEFRRFFIDVKLSEFSTEIQSHFRHFGEFFVRPLICQMLNFEKSKIADSWLIDKNI